MGLRRIELREPNGMPYATRYIADAESDKPATANVGETCFVVASQLEYRYFASAWQGSASVAETYAPGSFTVADGRFRILSGRLQLTGAQRCTIAGTGRVRVT